MKVLQNISRKGLCLLSIISAFSFQSLSASSSSSYQVATIIPDLMSDPDPRLIGYPLGLTFENIDNQGDLFTGIQQPTLSQVTRYTMQGSPVPGVVTINPSLGRGTMTMTLETTLSEPDFIGLDVNHISATDAGNLVGYKNLPVGVDQDATPLVEDPSPEAFYFGLTQARIKDHQSSIGVIVATDIRSGSLDFFTPSEDMHKLVRTWQFRDNEVLCKENFVPVAVEAVWPSIEHKKEHKRIHHDEFEAKNCDCREKDKCPKVPFIAVLYTKINPANFLLVPTNQAFVRVYKFGLCNNQIKVIEKFDFPLIGECIIPTSMTVVPREATLGLDGLNLVVMQNEPFDGRGSYVNLVAYNLDTFGKKSKRLPITDVINTGWQVRYTALHGPQLLSFLYFTARGDTQTGQVSVVQFGSDPIKFK